MPVILDPSSFRTDFPEGNSPGKTGVPVGGGGGCLGWMNIFKKSEIKV